jgi:uncharacterized membrane protein YdbT with pleckstrin-like domain
MGNVGGTQVFRGQQVGEGSLLLAREHWLYLVRQAWPALVAFVAFVVLVNLQVAAAITTVAGLGLIGLLARWLIVDALPWWFRRYIVTTQRVIVRAGVFRQTSNEIALRNIQSVSAEITQLDELLFGYGRVIVLAAGGNGLTLRGIPRPRAVAALISQARSQRPTAGTQPLPNVADPAMQQTLDMLAAQNTVPIPAQLAPACTHRWPLSRAVNIPLDPDETVLGIVSRHWWFLARSTGISIAIMFLAIFLFFRGFWQTFSGLSIDVIAFVGSLVAFAISYLNFADDVYIFTSRRIIDVQRLFFILFSSKVFIEYDKIQEIRTVVPTFWARLLQFGTVTINAAGVSGMVLDGVPHPNVLAQAIERNRVEVRQRNEVITANREKQKLKEWFATVLGQMVVVVPDVVGQPLDQALEEALRVGLRPVVVEVVAQQPGAPAGIVISQNPTAGARALYGSDITFVVRRAP